MGETTPDRGAARGALVQRFVAERGHHLGFLRLLVGDAALAEDLFQDLSVAVFESLDRYDGQRDFARWVRGVARNLVRKRAAQARTGAGRFQPLVSEAVADAIAAAYDADDASGPDMPRRMEGLRRCLAELGSRQRRLLEARYTEGRSSADIAALLAMRAGAVDTALCRLRAALADCVRRRAGATP